MKRVTLRAFTCRFTGPDEQKPVETTVKFRLKAKKFLFRRCQHAKPFPIDWVVAIVELADGERKPDGANRFKNLSVTQGDGVRAELDFGRLNHLDHEDHYKKVG